MVSMIVHVYPEIVVQRDLQRQSELSRIIPTKYCGEVWTVTSGSDAQPYEIITQSSNLLGLQFKIARLLSRQHFAVTPVQRRGSCAKASILNGSIDSRPAPSSCRTGRGINRIMDEEEL